MKGAEAMPLPWYLFMAMLVLTSAALMLVAGTKSGRARGGFGTGRFFDAAARPWTITALALLGLAVVMAVATVLE